MEVCSQAKRGVLIGFIEGGLVWTNKHELTYF